jgi:hypothetical protein
MLSLRIQLHNPKVIDRAGFWLERQAAPELRYSDGQRRASTSRSSKSTARKGAGSAA